MFCFFDALRIKRGHLLQKFLQQEEGVTLPLLGLSFLVMIGFVGVAVDVSRSQLVQSRLSFALDAAGLAAGSTVSTTNVSTEVMKYLNANFPTGYLGATAPEVSVFVSDNKMVITLEAKTTVDPVFMQLFGKGTQTVKASSQITRTASGLEIVLALDNTGSMSGTKLSSLKSAATSLVNILYGGRATAEKLWIGLVPFSQAVNIGTSRTAWLNSTTFNWGPTSWAGCVDARLGGLDVTDDPPSSGLFQQYYWPSDANNTWETTYYGTTTYNITSSRGPNLYCPQRMQFLTSNKTTILNAINTMTATGNTHVNLGLVWGWRMLSPRWKSAWNSLEAYEGEQLPLQYGATHMNKAVVLLTDGANTMSSNVRTAYWYLSDRRLGTTYSSAAVNELNDRMMQVCDSLKAQGVYVYTIALGNPGTQIQNFMRSCATAVNYYFNSPSSSDLQNVFSAIADSLSNLRVSQ